MVGFAIFVVICLAPFTQQAALSDTKIGKCPEEDGPTPTYYPDPNNCRRFFECNHGYPFLIPCPPMTVFDSRLNVCVDSPDGKCLPEVSHLRLTRSLLSLERVPHLAKECPAHDGYWTTYVLHESNCSRFYKCSNGRKILQECPDGLEYNPKLLVCDYPDRAGCVINRTLFLDEELKDGPSLAKKCPKVDGRWPTYLIDPKHCNQFYQCSNGVPILKRCQPGTYFNPNVLACDHPENVDCSHRPSKLESLLAAAEVTEDGPHLAKKCPEEDGEYPTFLLNPTDCTEYFECSHGVPYLHRCPAGLAFSPDELTCDIAAKVGCNMTQLLSVGNMLNNNGPTLATKCPKKDGRYPTYLINPTHCNMFYECSHGQPFGHVCPPGLLFNRVKLACDYRENVKC